MPSNRQNLPLQNVIFTLSVKMTRLYLLHNPKNDRAKINITDSYIYMGLQFAENSSAAVVPTGHKRSQIDI